MFETNAEQVQIRADTRAWDEVFERDAPGRVRRKAQAEPRRLRVIS